MIEGSISVPEGITEAALVPLESPPYSAPATRQIYGEFGGYDRSSGELTLVHAPEHLRDPTTEKLRTGAFRTRFPFDSKDERDEHIRRILRSCETDVFVAPATGSRSTKRIVVWGRQLEGDTFLFAKFVRQCFKRIPGTQTSDQ